MLDKDIHYACVFSAMVDQIQQRIPEWKQNPIHGLNWQTPAVCHDGSDLARQWVGWYSFEMQCYAYCLRLRVFDNTSSNSQPSA